MLELLLLANLNQPTLIAGRQPVEPLTDGSRFGYAPGTQPGSDTWINVPPRAANGQFSATPGDRVRAGIRELRINDAVDNAVNGTPTFPR